ncbi:MAG: hypothetical protein CO117_06960 [Flavobacteriaceae bacterium CG_4_9_14_3_um_filter_33_16]|nr:MAG: hypothetical protein CO117_06960 [Flavobacteriaceae bacterium CG_4_9_14_3_um_filter_33_16]
MIKFFRNIRKKLIEQSKFRNYFFYAIGEILLVVIGILIALQVGTWNEQRKLDKQQQLYLMRLLQDNKSDLETFESEITRLEKNNQTTAKFCELIKDTRINDSLLVNSASDFVIYGSLYPRFNPSLATFKDLSSTGNLSLIKDTGLRDSITSHYQKYELIKLEFQININWAVPIDAPLFIETDALKFETNNTAFLFPDESITEKAKSLRNNQDLYTRYAALHYWINRDCIAILKEMRDKTGAFINLLERHINSK